MGIFYGIQWDVVMGMGRIEGRIENLAVLSIHDPIFSGT